MANFSQIYEQYSEQVYFFLRELSGNDSFAEELTWKTFYQAFLHVDSFENRGSVFDWLCQIGKAVYWKEMKRRGRTVSGEESKHLISGAEGGSSGGEVSDVERKRRIRRGLRRIRRRWVCSILAAAVILLMLMGAILTHIGTIVPVSCSQGHPVCREVQGGND